MPSTECAISCPHHRDLCHETDLHSCNHRYRLHAPCSCVCHCLGMWQFPEIGVPQNRIPWYCNIHSHLQKRCFDGGILSLISFLGPALKREKAWKATTFNTRNLSFLGIIQFETPKRAISPKTEPLLMSPTTSQATQIVSRSWRVLSSLIDSCLVCCKVSSYDNIKESTLMLHLSSSPWPDRPTWLEQSPSWGSTSCPPLDLHEFYTGSARHVHRSTSSEG